MFKSAIPRGVIYHNISFDIKNLFKGIFYPLNKNETINDFEKVFKDYIGSQYCVAFPYARTGIYFSLKSQNYEEGAEILMPPITIKPILDVVLDLKLKPVFVDIDPNTLCFDLNDLNKKITKQTKAILITYLYGVVPNLNELIKFCNKNKLFVIEDFSQCLNGKFENKKVGTFGDIGVYSSSKTKTLDVYGGGLCVTNNSDLFNVLKKFQKNLSQPKRLRILKIVMTDFLLNLATQRIIFNLATFRLIKILTRFSNTQTIKYVGSRSGEPLETLPTYWFEKFTSFQAKIGLELINDVDGLDEKRIFIVEEYKKSIKEITFPKGVPQGDNVYWQFLCYFKNPSKFQKILQKYNVDLSSSSLSRISNLEKYKYRDETPNADYIYENSLFIPSYPSLTNKDMTYLIKIFNEKL